MLLGLVVIGATPAAQAGFLAPGLTGEARVTPLFEMTAPATAMPRALVRDVILWRATIDPGNRVVAPAETGDCCPGPQFVHVLAGELALRVDGPLQVVRAGVDRAPEAVEDVPPGAESVLRPGDSAVVRFELAAEYANLGATPPAWTGQLLPSRGDPGSERDARRPASWRCARGDHQVRGRHPGTGTGWRPGEYRPETGQCVRPSALSPSRGWRADGLNLQRHIFIIATEATFIVAPAGFGLAFAPPARPVQLAPALLGVEEQQEQQASHLRPGKARRDAGVRRGQRLVPGRDLADSAFG